MEYMGSVEKWRVGATEKWACVAVDAMMVRGPARTNGAWREMDAGYQADPNKRTTTGLNDSLVGGGTRKSKEKHRKSKPGRERRSQYSLASIRAVGWLG